MTYNKLKIPQLNYDVIQLIMTFRNDILEKEEEFIEEHCHDITGQSYVEQEEHEWGEKCLCIAGGGEHACYIEFNGDKYRYNWVCRHEVETIKNLWIIMTDGCQYITDVEPPKKMFEDYYNLNDLE